MGTWMYIVAGAIVMLMMMLTVTDVVGRYFFGMPIKGSYELISFLGATVFGLIIAKTSLDRGHVSVDILIEGRSEAVKNVLFVLTRIPGIALFAGLTWFLVLKGFAFYKGNQVSSILEIPFFYLVWVLACCCLMECLVLVGHVLETFEDKGERG
jgi:TRAP-type transport system small permease protein